MKHRYLKALAAIAALGLTSCSGALGDASGSPGDDPNVDPRDVLAACAANGSAKVGVSKLRRLNRVQYRNSVRDLLKAAFNEPSIVASFENTKLGPFATNSTIAPSALDVDRYREAAEKLAEAAAQKLDEVTGCNAAAEGEQACADRFINSFGLRAYRHPLTDDEKNILATVYNVGKQESFAAGIRLVIETVLQSPSFLYLVEEGGAPGQPAVANPFETATRLSYLLWDTTPDDELLQKAQRGELSTIEQIAASAERLIRDPRAIEVLKSFHLQWLGLDDLNGVVKDPARFPEFTPEMLVGMRQETEAFIASVFTSGEGAFATLLTAPYSYPNAQTLPLYGLSADKLESDGRATFDAGQRAGLLTQPSFLAKYSHRDETSPVHRGLVIRRNLLCDTLPPPPAAAMFDRKDLGLSPREQLRRHQEDPSCSGCHRLVDNIGLSFENYDPVGRYVTTDAHGPIDASGGLLGTDVDGDFVGARALAEQLAKSKKAQNCFAKQWFAYGLGRSVTKDDACSVAAVQVAFDESGGDVRHMIAALVTSDAFRYRRGE